MLRLGLGYAPIANLLGLNKSTVSFIVPKRIAQKRYEGFDLEWVKLRAEKSHKNRKPKDTSLKKATQTYASLWMDEILTDRRYWKKYEADCNRRYRYLENKVKVKKVNYRDKFREENIFLYNEYVEKQRIKHYLKKGYALENIPVKGAFEASLVLTADQQKEIKRIRRKRESLRCKVTQVWKGLVGDAAAINRLGCSVLVFTQHIESQMKEGWTRENYGVVWNFDHIKPCAAFNVFDKNEAKALNHYTNIRPYCVIENSRKGARWEESLSLCM